MSHQSKAEVAYCEGLVIRDGHCARLVLPPPREAQVEKAIEFSAAKALDYQEHFFYVGKFLRGVVGQERTLEPIDLKDYLQRTLPTCIEYIFTVLISGKSRNFSLWDRSTWASFFRRIINLNKDLIVSAYGENLQQFYHQADYGTESTQIFLAPMPGLNQSLYALIQELLPQAMMKALVHAVDQDLLDPFDLDFDYPKALSDDAYLAEFEQSTASSDQKTQKKTERLVSLPQEIPLLITKVLETMGERGFVDDVLTVSFISDEDMGEVVKDMTIEQKNELYVQIRIMMRMAAQKLAYFLDAPLMEMYSALDLLSRVADSNEDGFNVFLDSKDYKLDLLKTRRPNEYQTLIAKLEEFYQFFYSLHSSQVFRNAIASKYQIIGGIVIMLDKLMRKTMVDDPKVHRVAFLQAATDFLADNQQIQKMIVEEGWIYSAD